jgi:hypothetical protein
LRPFLFVPNIGSSTPSANPRGGLCGNPWLQSAVPEESILLGGLAFMNAAATGIWQKNPSLAWREIDGETVIISPGESVMHELNDTGSFVWTNIDGHRNAEALATLLTQQYEVAYETALSDTVSLLQDLSTRKLLVPVESPQGGAGR